MSTDLVFIRTLMYDMKRAYGTPVTLYQVNSSVVDNQTGKKVVTKTRYEIERAVLIPTSLQRKDSLAQAVANKNFAYGGKYDVNDRQIYIDQDDLDGVPEIDLNWILIIKHKRFELKLIEDIDGYATLLTARELKGQIPNEIQELCLINDLKFNQIIGGGT